MPNKPFAEEQSTVLLVYVLLRCLPKALLLPGCPSQGKPLPRLLYSEELAAALSAFEGR